LFTVSFSYLAYNSFSASPLFALGVISQNQPVNLTAGAPAANNFSPDELEFWSI
jgi:hypothetical protein